MADQQPSGRARGRSRGRGRASTGPQQAPPRRPGEAAPTHPMPPAAPEPLPTPGRGRSRGGSATLPGSGAAVAMEPRAPPSAPPTAQMAALSMGASGGAGVGGVSTRKAPTQVMYEARPQPVEKRGTAGNAIELLTNCFHLKPGDQWLLYQYDVTFNPEVVSPRARQGLLRFHTEALGSPMAFDGQTLFLLRRLDQPVTTLQTRRRDNDEIVTLTVTLRRELAPNSPTCIQVYNIIFRKILGLMGMQQIGRHYFNPNRAAVIEQHNLQLWPGFITSILQYEQEVLLMADVSHKILRTDTVLDILRVAYETKGSGRFVDEAVRKLVGQIVLTSYNNKTYRVDDIDWEKNPTCTFSKFDGTQISYAQYYQEAYNHRITDLEQPLLVSRPKKRDERRGMTGPIHLIPELCMLTGLSDEARNDFHIMRDIASHTRITPNDRLTSLTTFIRSFPEKPEAQDYLNKWNMSFDPNPVRIKARVLNPLFIKFKQSQADYKPEDADWSGKIRNNKLITCVALQDWLLIYTNRDRDKANDFMNSLTRVGPPLGLAVSQPQMFLLKDDRTDSFINCIRQNLSHTTQMVVCILPTNRKDRYDAIKKHCCLEAPVPSQCVLGRTLGKKQTIMSVATKIIMQINCKMGGELWAVDIPTKVPMMVIGVDSYHDSSTRGRSVGGFVASMNETLTRYYSRCTFQHTGQELIDGLMVCLLDALKKFQEINGILPQRVVLYRDGVGDGQLPAVVEHELPQIVQTFRSIGTDYMPKFAMIVVKKRINNRFFHAMGRQLKNPPPGTVIDSVVTKPDLYEFFLVSQSVRQGTVTPTNYNVIWDTSELLPNHIQSLTYRLTHLYYNWPGTIRVPAPCLYAHKLSFLVGQSLHKQPHLDIADRLFYL